MSSNPDPVDHALDRWKTPAERFPHLGPEVWRRIHASERSSILAELLAGLARPSFAAMFVVCCTFLGLFLAEVRINREQRERSALLARSYLQLIDPLLNSDRERQP